MGKIINPNDPLRNASPEQVMAARKRMMSQMPPMDPDAVLMQSLGMSSQLLAGAAHRGMVPTPAIMLIAQVHMQTGAILYGMIENIVRQQKPAVTVPGEPAPEAEDTEPAPDTVAKGATDAKSEETGGDGAGDADGRHPGQ